MNSGNVTAIFEMKSGLQVLTEASAIKAMINPQAKLMEHPVESGSTITDHRVRLPTEIQLSVIISSDQYRDVYAQIASYYNSATLLQVQTRSSVYSDMLIAAMPHDEDPGMMDALPVALTLREVIFVTPEFSEYKVEKKPQSKTVKKGQVQAKETADTGKSQSAAAGIADTVKGWFQ